MPTSAGRWRPCGSCGAASATASWRCGSCPGCGRLPPTDRRYYPLYAACVDLDIPFCTQVGHTGPLRPSETGRPIPYIDQVAIDFPELVIVCGHIGYPWTTEMIAVADKHPNVYIDTSAYAAHRYPAELVEYLKGRGAREGAVRHELPDDDGQAGPGPPRWPRAGRCHPSAVLAGERVARVPAVNGGPRLDEPEAGVQQGPWQQTAAAVAAAVGTDVGRGLTSEEAARRIEQYGPNQLDAAPPVPAWRKLLAQFADPLIYLLLAAVVVSLVAWAVEGAEGVPFDAVVITVIVVLNAVLGYVQEARAEQAVAALQRMAAAIGRRRARRPRGARRRPPTSCRATCCCWPRATR